MQISQRHSSHRRGIGSPFLILMLAAIPAGLLAGASVVKLGSYFRYPPKLEADLSNPNANIDSDEVHSWNRRLLYSNTVLTSAATGIIFVGLMGLAAAIAAPSGSRVVGLVLGLALGAVCGALGGLAGATVWQILFDNKLLVDNAGDTTTLAAIANACIWAVIGAGAGVAVCWRGNWVNGVVAGIVGGILGACMFLLVAAFTVASVRTGLPVPENMDGTSWVAARFLWAFVPAIVIGLLVARSDTFKHGAKEASEPQAETSELD